MAHRVEIIEVDGRSVQGITRPFRCRGDDQQWYYVKGRGAGRRSQLCEWFAGHLALGFGLNLAPVAVANIDGALENAVEDWRELGDGPAFASKSVAPLQELTWSAVEDVPLEVQVDVLLFDLWVRNQDRQLSELGGNPNLFWSPNSQSVVVIDHNQAFDDEFSADQFRETHIFRGAIPQIDSDFDTRKRVENQCLSALAKWQEAVDSCPDDWDFEDDEKTVRPRIDLVTIKQDLVNRSATLIQEIWQ